MMTEKLKHREAFEYYCIHRNLRQVGKKFNVSQTSLNKWSKEFNWRERLMVWDQKTQEGVNEKMMPEWIEVKSYLLKTLIEQVKLGREDGVKPTSTRDMTAAIREIRSMMGESDNVDLNISGIEYVPAKIKSKVDNNENQEN